MLARLTDSNGNPFFYVYEDRSPAVATMENMRDGKVTLTVECEGRVERFEKCSFIACIAFINAYGIKAMMADSKLHE